MVSALFDCPVQWEPRLPPGMVPLRSWEDLAAERWDLLVLTAEGCRRLGEGRIECRQLLVPGDCPAGSLCHVTAETVAAYGLSPRDSLTFSSLEEPVLCVQRRLPRPDGSLVEPQEFPLPRLPLPPERLLPLLGARLLQMPLTDVVSLW